MYFYLLNFLFDYLIDYNYILDNLEMARKNATLNELIDDAVEDNSMGLLDIYITPPDGDGSDVDSGPEDDEDGPRNISNLPGSILRAEAERVDYSNDDEVQADTQPQGSKKKKGRTWVAGDIPTKLDEFDALDQAINYVFQGLDFRDMNDAAALFIFDPEVLEVIREYSIKYARRKNDFLFDVTLDELKVFFCIIVLSGYVKVNHC